MHNVCFSPLICPAKQRGVHLDGARGLISCTKVLLQNLAVVRPVASVPELVLRSMRTSQTAVSHPKPLSIPTRYLLDTYSVPTRYLLDTQSEGHGV